MIILSNPAKTLSFTLERFAVINRYAFEAQGLSVKFTILNNPTITGPLSATEKQFWQVDAYMDPSVADLFWAIYSDSRQRAVGQQDPSLDCIDLIRPMVEGKPVSRRLSPAPYAAVVDLPANMAKYYPLYKVMILKPVFKGYSARGHNISFNLVEQ